ncbi:MAG: NADH-quinone oxidoreductase subunit C [Desulfovibrio sp.]|nr:NADH-quinone oxidoreductase subunit C [Desulfovibrio sp.]
MEDIIKGNADVMTALDKLCSGKNAIQHTNDFFGNAFNWYTLDLPETILDAAKELYKHRARLAMITAYNREQENKEEKSLCYEFVIEGVVYSITANLDAAHDSVPSLSRIFPNADWHEREMMELYGIKITDHPNPRRLFLDEKLDKGLLGEIVPLSVMMNGASSAELWERILADKETK